MANLSREEIARLAKGAGFSGNDVNIAVAVALAESGGNPRAHNPTPPDDSYGLWQINMLGSMGPDRRKRYGLSSNEDLYQPATNARVAYGIWQGSGWKAWTTYTRGTYKRFMGSDADTPSGSTPDTQPDVPSGIGISDSIARGANAVSSSLFKGIANVSGILLAIALIVVGVLILGREQVAKVIPAGAVKKVLK